MRTELLLVLMTNNNNIGSCWMGDDNLKLELFWNGARGLELFKTSSIKQMIQGRYIMASSNSVIMTQHPPMHQLWMKFFWAFWDEPKPFNLNHTKHWGGFFTYFSIICPSFRFQKFPPFFFSGLHFHLLLLHCYCSFFFIIFSPFYGGLLLFFSFLLFCCCYRFFFLSFFSFICVVIF
jgi:hypothetical protein